MNASAGHSHAAGERFPPAAGQAVFTLPISSLRAGDSPRLGGEDTQHIRLLAESEAPLPPIVVHRATMRIIDGMHRLRVAHLRGRRTIDVVFFDGTEDEAFVMAVQANMAHGLPLCRADREAAAARLLTRDPRRSDRWIASIAGLSAGTVAAIRRRSGRGGEPDAARIGQDGRVRPLNSAAGRQLARDAILQNPGASLREIATAAGISPTTVRDVRERLRRGEDPVPRPPGTAAGRAGGGTRPAPRRRRERTGTGSHCSASSAGIRPSASPKPAALCCAGWPPGPAGRTAGGTWPTQPRCTPPTSLRSWPGCARTSGARSRITWNGGCARRRGRPRQETTRGPAAERSQRSTKGHRRR